MLMLQADSEGVDDCFSYFSQNYMGISFTTSHNAGDYFDIIMKYSDIEEYMLNENILQ